MKIFRKKKEIASFPSLAIKYTTLPLKISKEKIHKICSIIRYHNIWYIIFLQGQQYENNSTCPISKSTDLNQNNV